MPKPPSKPLPRRFDPDAMARDGARYEASAPLSSFERLSVLLQGTDGDVHLCAGFTRRKDHIVIGGRLRASYALQCQRCLSPMTLAVDEPFEFTCVADQQAAEALPDAFDPVVLDDAGYLTTRTLLEDELILHVPLIARHADVAECAPLPADVVIRSPDDVVVEARRSPFDALKNLDLH